MGRRFNSSGSVNRALTTAGLEEHHARMRNSVLLVDFIWKFAARYSGSCLRHKHLADLRGRGVRHCMTETLPAVDAYAHADAGRANADAGARAVIPVATIRPMLVIAFARHGVVGVTHDHTRAAARAVAAAGIVADEAHLLDEIRICVLAAYKDIGSLRTRRGCQRALRVRRAVLHGAAHARDLNEQHAR